MEKRLSFDEINFEVLRKDFYDFDREYFLRNKPLNKRLSSNYIDYANLRDEKDFLDKAMRLLTRTAYTLFSFVTKETSPIISFNYEDNQSYCSLAKNKIQIGVNLLGDEKTTRQIKVDTLIGILFHEFYHKTYTITDIRKSLGGIEPSKFYNKDFAKKHVEELVKDPVFKNVWNIFEDKRIEALGTIEFPGYTFYFEEKRKYSYYYNYGKRILPEYENYILDFLCIKILIPELKSIFLNQFDESLEIIKEYYKSKPEDISIEDFEKIVTSHSNVKDLLKKLEDFIDANPSEAYSLDYKSILNFSQKIVDLIPSEIKKVIEDNIANHSYISILVPGGKSLFQNENKLNENELDLIVLDELNLIESEEQSKERIIEDKVEIIKLKSKNSFQFTEIHLVDEPLSNIDTSLFVEAKKISKNIVNNLGFLESKFSRIIENYELTEGELDYEELYTIGFNNKTIFEEVEDLPQYSLDFGILLDESGSMSSLIKEAKLAVLSLILGLKDNAHINLFVYGHTADDDREKGFIKILRYFDTIENKVDYRTIFSAKSRSNNADGFAIEKMADFMKKSKSREKIMVVVSDGYPQAYGYGGEDAEFHVKSTVDKLEREGITVIQVCMAHIENSPKMFNHYVPFEKNGKFFDNLKKILLTKLNQFSESI